MDRISISENVKRRLFAESMGKCMNPACEKDLFIGDGDIVERAHIIPYCKTADNAFENLIILCPNCHTQFDKGLSFSEEENPASSGTDRQLGRRAQRTSGLWFGPPIVAGLELMRARGSIDCRHRFQDPTKNQV